MTINQTNIESSFEDAARLFLMARDINVKVLTKHFSFVRKQGKVMSHLLAIVTLSIKGKWCAFLHTIFGVRTLKC